jgi:hypothetical protein
VISSGHSKCDTSFAWRRSFSLFGCGGCSGWSSGGTNSSVSGLATCSSLSGLNEGVLEVSRRAVGRKEASEANIAQDKAGPMSPSCLFGGLGAVSRITVTYARAHKAPSCLLAPTQRQVRFHGLSVFPAFFTRQPFVFQFLIRHVVPAAVSLSLYLARSAPRSNAFLFTYTPSLFPSATSRRHSSVLDPHLNYFVLEPLSYCANPSDKPGHPVVPHIR